MALSPQQVDVAILCGGLGTRLRSVTGEDTPKIMVKVGDAPFLDILYQYLFQSGFRRFIFCTGYKSSAVENYFHQKNSSIIFSVENEPLGTAGALKNAQVHFKSDTMLALNGDSFCPMDYRAFLNFHHTKKALASFVLTEMGERRDGGSVTIDQEERIVSFQEKQAQTTNWMSAGIYFFNRSILNKIPQGKTCSLEREVFPNLPREKTYGYRIREHLYDIGTPERLEVFKKVYADLQAAHVIQ